MVYFRTLTQKSLINIIQNTKSELFISLPSVHKEVADAISYLSYSSSYSENEVEIHILVDFDSKTFRLGYGEFEAIEDLIKGEFEVKCLKNNRVSFIISDNVGYYLLIESRSLIPADKETINAVRIDPVSIVRLKSYFFENNAKQSLQDELTNAIIEESKTLNTTEELLPEESAPIQDINDEAVQTIKQDLENNPPISPDFKRIVEFYANKFQYVKLKFEGANMQHRKIEIPAWALPISDASLKERLETKLNLFEKNQEVFKPLLAFKKKVDHVRETYLSKARSREESLLDKQKKAAFAREVDCLKEEMVNVHSEVLDTMAMQIDQTKKSLQKDLEDFFNANPQSLFAEESGLWKNSPEYSNPQPTKQVKSFIISNGQRLTYY